MHEVLVNRLGGLSLSRKSVVRLTDRPDMTLDVYRGRKTTMQHVTGKSTDLAFKFGKIVGLSLFDTDNKLRDLFIVIIIKVRGKNSRHVRLSVPIFF